MKEKSYVKLLEIISGSMGGTFGVKWVWLFLKYLHLRALFSCAIHCQNGSEEID